jgi:YHS domain-containing protein
LTVRRPSHNLGPQVPGRRSNSNDNRDNFLLTFLLAVQGCKKQEPAAQQPPKPPVDQAVTAAKDTAKTTQETAQAVATEAMAAIEQTTCPVMDGNPIDKTLFVEYEGKKVYFCCKECEEKFLADPAEYVAKLPQFQE